LSKQYHQAPFLTLTHIKNLNYISFQVVTESLNRWLKWQRRRVLGIEKVIDIPIDVREAACSGIVVEIGGPTPFFQASGFVPIYPLLSNLLIYNYASETRWEQKKIVQIHNRDVEIQTAEAASLPLPDKRAALILSSHVIEHLANPIAGLEEIVRILSPSGRLLMIVPHRDGAYDHKRPVTTMAHLENDLSQNISEADSTHFEEILRMHDLDRDTTTNSFDDLKKTVLSNSHTRFCHHHVFDTRLVISILDRVGLEPTFLKLVRPYHIVVTAKLKSAKGYALSQSDIEYSLKRSPFGSDRSR
jgi:SAM-dependent methyltransferase